MTNINSLKKIIKIHESDILKYLTEYGTRFFLNIYLFGFLCQLF